MCGVDDVVDCYIVGLIGVLCMYDGDVRVDCWYCGYCFVGEWVGNVVDVWVVCG